MSIDRLGRARSPWPAISELVSAAESEVRPSDLLVVVNTSGATAAPKSVVHTNGSLIRHGCLMASLRKLDAEDCIFTAAPLFWVGGLTLVLLSAMASGASVALQERFEAGSALDLIEAAPATQISCWPPAARAMAEHPSFAARDLSAIRGGTLVEALPPEIRPENPSASPLLASLGMTETGGPHTAADDPYALLPPERYGTFGRALPGVEHLIASNEKGKNGESDRGRDHGSRPSRDGRNSTNASASRHSRQTAGIQRETRDGSTTKDSCISPDAAAP